MIGRVPFLDSAGKIHKKYLPTGAPTNLAPTTDLTGVVDASAALLAAVAAAAGGGRSGEVVIPLGATLKLIKTLSIPEGVTVRNFGTILLGPTAVIALTGRRARLIGGTVTHIPAAGANYLLRMSRDDTVVEGVTFRNNFRTAALRVSYADDLAVAGTIRNVLIKDCVFHNVGYAVLKMNAPTITTNAKVISNEFRDITAGDAIEWNIGPSDTGLLIANNTINGVARGNVSNAGIGIGVSGGLYDGNVLTQTRRFSVVDNIIQGTAEGIHIEACNRFLIAGNVVSGTVATTELTGAGVQVYGSTDFSVRGNMVTDSAMGVGIQWGPGPGGTFHSTRYTVAGNDIFACDKGIRVWSEGFGNTATLLGNSLSNCALGYEVRGVANWVVEGNTSTGSLSHTLKFDRFDEAVPAPVPATLALLNNIFHDAAGNAVIAVTGLSNLQVIRDEGNTFGLAQPLASSGRVLHAAAQPKATEVRAGDLILNTAAGAPIGWLVTTGGSQQKVATSYYFVATAGNNYVVATSPVGDPAAAFAVGQRVTLAGIGPAGAAVTATITRIYPASSQNRIEFSGIVSTSVGVNMLITLPSISAFKVL